MTVENHCGLIKNEDKVQHFGLIRENDLNKTLKRFWEIETVKVESKKRTEQALCEEHYGNPHFRDDSGKYVVKISLKKTSCLGRVEILQLLLWPRLLKTNYCELYKKFLKECERLRHMRLHIILRISRYTDQRKVPLNYVFNYSSKTSNDTSLNSIQLNGGVIQRYLFSIMIGFREHSYVFTDNVEMMYRIIKINPNQ